MFENGLYNITVKDATSTGLFLGQQKSTSDKSQELLPPILESLSRSVLTRVTLCGEGCKVANRDEDCGHVTSSPPIPAHLVAAGDALPVAPADVGDHLLYPQVELVLMPLVRVGVCNTTFETFFFFLDLKLS